MPIIVFLDTTALPRHLKRPGGAFEVLSQLVEIGLVQIHISIVSKYEWVSQIYEQAAKHIDQCLGALEDTTRNPVGLNPELGKVISDAIDALRDEKRKLLDLVTAEVNSTLESIKATILHVADSHGKAALDAYFSGKPPFRAPKHRDDFPDAFIFQAAKDLRVQSKGTLLFVTADARLASAIEGLDDVKILSDLKVLIQSEGIVGAQLAVKYQAVWNEGFDDFAKQIPGFEDLIVSELKGQIESELAWKKIHSSIIPDDNAEALITQTSPPDEIELDFDHLENLGAGWVSIPFVATATVLADFYVYRSDAYHQPDWVHVTYADPDENYYFEAQAYFVIQIIGSVSVSFADSELETGRLEEPSQIELDDELTLEIVDPE